MSSLHVNTMKYYTSDLMPVLALLLLCWLLAGCSTPEESANTQRFLGSALVAVGKLMGGNETKQISKYDKDYAEYYYGQ